MNRQRVSGTAAATILSLFCAQAGAVFLDGQLLGVFDGLVDAETIEVELDLIVESIAIIESPDTAADGLKLVALPGDDSDSDSDDFFDLARSMFDDDDEPYGDSDSDSDSDSGGASRGGWTYTGPETVGLIVVSDGNQSAVYLFDDGQNKGIWDLSAFGDSDSDLQLEVLAAYRVVPLPAGLWLLGSALAGFVALRQRR